MPENKNTTDVAREADKLLRTARWITGIAVLSATAGALFLAIKFWGRTIPVAIEKWGQAGDYLGGLINPIVGLSTVLLIFIGIHIQRGELRATEKQLTEANKESKKQSFEQSLFSWISNYQSLLDSISIEPEKHGRSALTALYKEYFKGLKFYCYVTHERYHKANSENDYPGFRDLVDGAADDEDEFATLSSIYIKSQLSFNDIYNSHISDLDALFRTLFRMLHWIDASNFTQEERWHYAALVRAQLSWIELTYLLYNSLNPVGSPFAELANKYALFDNLNVQPDSLLRAIKEIFVNKQPVDAKAGWLLESRAFNSAEAKKALGIPLST